MEIQGLYNLTVEAESRVETRPRVGLLNGRTGVPVCLLYLQDESAYGSRLMHSLEDVESQILKASSPWDKKAWELVLPFFEMEGSQLHVVSLPISSKEDKRLEEMIGYDRGLRRRTGVHALKSAVEYSDLVVVPQASSILTPKLHRKFYQTMFDVLSTLDHYFVILDFPKHMEESLLTTWLKGITFPDSAAYYPWLMRDNRIIPPALAVAAHYQHTDAHFGINEIPANRDLPKHFRPLKRFAPIALQSFLDKRINVIHEFSDGSTRLWGGRTTADPLDLDSRFISTRRTVQALREALHQICEPFVLEPMQPDLADFVDVAIQSALQPHLKVFDSNAKQPFQTKIAIEPHGTEDVLQVNVLFSIPYAVDQMSISLGLTG